MFPGSSDRRSARKRNGKGWGLTVAGWGVGQSKLTRKKTTPSGSKCGVPAAPIAGPLKSPAPTRYQAPRRANVNWLTIGANSFRNGAGLKSLLLLVAVLLGTPVVGSNS